MQIYHIENRLTLTYMEITIPQRTVLLREPELQQFLRRGCHLFQQFATLPRCIYRLAESLG